MTSPSYQPNDIAALEALRFAMVSCNAADTPHLQYQSGGAYGHAYDGFLNAATALFGDDKARLLLDIIIDSGENVAYCLDYITRNYESKPISGENLGKLADAISDAIFNTLDYQELDVSLPAITAALPAFIAHLRDNETAARH